MRPGPVVNGKKELWHFEKLAGVNAVFTCPPKYIDIVNDEFTELEYGSDSWKEPVPEEVLEKLHKFRYFREAYDGNGLEPPQFNTHPATVATAKAFSKATDEMEDFVRTVVR
jgi:hypothetical protein